MASPVWVCRGCGAKSEKRMAYCKVCKPGAILKSLGIFAIPVLFLALALLMPILVKLARIALIGAIIIVSRMWLPRMDIDIEPGDPQYIPPEYDRESYRGEEFDGLDHSTLGFGDDGFDYSVPGSTADDGFDYSVPGNIADDGFDYSMPMGSEDEE